MKKKLLVILLSICIAVASAFALTACGETGTPDNGNGGDTTVTEPVGDGIQYKLLDDDTYEVSGYNGTAAELTIPSTHEDKNVTSIGEKAFYNADVLTSVTIPGSVTTIAKFAFEYCTNMTSVTMLDGVTTIGQAAFSHCTKLADVTIPESVKSVEVDAFTYCNNIKYNEYENAYYLGNTANPYVFLKKAKSTEITGCTIHANTKLIYRGAFRDCASLTGSITIPAGITFIDQNVFNGCSRLASIIIPNSVTEICGSAFYGCTSFTDVTIPASVTTIEFHAFAKCTGLDSIFIPAGVTKISRYAFAGCNSNFVINCAAASTPSGWDSKWNNREEENNAYAEYTVNWNCED